MTIHEYLFLHFTDKVPHFTRLGDVEVNAGQNATFQCVANGRASKMDPFTMEVRESEKERVSESG